MTDIHCHIIPEVDDGARNMETALRMARMAWEGGTDAVIATPHFCRPDQPFSYDAGELLKRTMAFRQILADRGIPLAIYPGMEVFASQELTGLPVDRELLPLGESRYLLVEFFFDEEADFMTDALHCVEDRGFWPVVAHPERYEAVQKRPTLALEWFRRGWLLQLNKGSILGSLGTQAQRTAWWLLHRGLAHAVASDAHGSQRRTPDLSGVWEQLGARLGWSCAKLLLETNPAAILKGRSVAQPEKWRSEDREMLPVDKEE